MISQHERRLRDQIGTLERMTRRNGSDIWTYRWVERGSGKRRRVRLGTTKELSTMQAVKKAVDGYRLTANHESDAVTQVTMSAALDRYERELIEPSIKVPLGAVDDGRIGSLTAKAYRSYPMEYVDLPHGSTLRQAKPRALTPAEYMKLLPALPTSGASRNQDRGGLGPRRSEGFGLKWQDLDFDRQVVTFRQGIVSGRITRLKTEASRTDVHSNNSYGGVVGLEGEYAVQRPRRLGVRKPSHEGETPVLARLYAPQLYPADRRSRWPRPHRLAYVSP
jgi:integrase